MTIKERIVILQKVSDFIDRLEEEKAQEESRVSNYALELADTDPSDFEYTWKSDAIAESNVKISGITTLIDKLNKIC